MLFAFSKHEEGFGGFLHYPIPTDGDWQWIISCLSYGGFLEKLHGCWDGILYACSRLCKATHFLS